MSDYSIVNLREADDDTGGRIDGMRGVFGRKYLDSRDLGVSLWSFAAGVRPPFAHSHREQEEAYVVVAGSGRVRLNDEVRGRPIRVGDRVTLYGAAEHSFVIERPEPADNGTRAEGMGDVEAVGEPAARAGEAEGWGS